MILFLIGALVLIAQQIADAVITMKTISSGVGTEANPLSAWFIKHLGLAGLFVEKLLVLPALVGLWLIGPPYWHVIWIFVVSYCVVIYSNYRVLNNQKGLFG